MLTLQHKSPACNVIRPRLDSRGNSNQGEGAGLSIGSFGAVPVSIYQHALLCTLFLCVCVGCTFASGEERPVLSPGPDDSLYFTSLHFSSQSLRVVSRQQPRPRTIPLFRPRCQKQEEKKKSIPRPCEKLLARAAFISPLSSFFFFCTVSLSAVQPSCWNR